MEPKPKFRALSWRVEERVSGRDRVWVSCRDRVWVSGRTLYGDGLVLWGRGT